MLLPPIISPLMVAALLMFTVLLRSITIPFITELLFSETVSPVSPLTLKITFAGVRPPVKTIESAFESDMPPFGTLITNDWDEEPDKVKIWFAPDMLTPSCKLITFLPGTVAVIVVLALICAVNVWSADNAASVVDALVALLAAWLIMLLPAGLEIVPARAVRLVFESLFPVNL